MCWCASAEVVARSADVITSTHASAAPTNAWNTVAVAKRSRRSVFLSPDESAGAEGRARRRRVHVDDGSSGDEHNCSAPTLGDTFEDNTHASAALRTAAAAGVTKDRQGTALWFARLLGDKDEGYYPKVWGSAQWACAGPCVPVALRDIQRLLWQCVDDEVRARNRRAGGDGQYVRPRLMLRVQLIRSLAAAMLHKAQLKRVKHGDPACAVFAITPDVLRDLFGAVAVDVVRTQIGLRLVEGGPPFAVQGASHHLRWCFTTDGELGEAVYHAQYQVLRLRQLPILYVCL